MIGESCTNYSMLRYKIRGMLHSYIVSDRESLVGSVGDPEMMKAERKLRFVHHLRASFSSSCNDMRYQRITHLSCAFRALIPLGYTHMLNGSIPGADRNRPVKAMYTK
jgi:hypothetical protein